LRLINLTTDPHEREATGLPHLHTWVTHHFNEILERSKRASVANRIARS